MKHQQNNEPGLAEIRAAAPEWAKFLCVTQKCAYPFWQNRIDPKCPTFGIDGIKYGSDGLPDSIPELRGTAINLRTGTAYIRKGKKVVEVTRREWDV
jgi:hypothetical protein